MYIDGEKLRRARKEKKLLQSEISKATGLVQSDISNAENNRREQPKEVLLKYFIDKHGYKKSDFLSTTPVGREEQLLAANIRQAEELRQIAIKMEILDLQNKELLLTVQQMNEHIKGLIDLQFDELNKKIEAQFQQLEGKK